MAYVEEGQSLATRRGQNLYSRKYSKDRRLFTFPEAYAFVGARRQRMADLNWWVYLPEFPPLLVLPVRPLTPSDLEELERALPF